MLLRTESLTKYYPAKNGRGKTFAAVNGASISLDAGETIGLFGDSGSGKSTLGLMLAGLISANSGRIFYQENPLKYPFHGEPRRRIQILFQHPEISFNPSLHIMTSMKEPYRLYHLPYSKEKLLEDIGRFGLHEEHLHRQPAELSGGELQRLALSRVLTVSPRVMILDEPTSMLDVITQGQILNMLKDYQRESGTAYVFITHNRVLCEMFCDRIYSVSSGAVTPE